MATFNVSTAAQLDSALNAVRSGDTIRLAGGDYGDLQMNARYDAHYQFASNTTIMSADPNNPAVFDAMLLRDVKNVTLDGLKFDMETTATTSTLVQDFKVEESDRVTIRNATFDGDDYKGNSAMERGYATGYGLRVNRSTNVTVEDSEFSNFRINANFSDSDGLVVRNNRIEGMSGDGLKFGGVKNVLIEGNSIGGHRTHPDDPFHRDMIQFLTSGKTTPTENVTIRGNTLHNGDGSWSQSMFISNEAVDDEGKGLAMYYRNILIEDNVIYNAQVHGIRVGQTIGLTIRNNTLLHNVDGEYRPAHAPEIVVSTAAQNVSIIDNIAQAVPDRANGSWTVAGNLIVQRTDPAAANYYDDLFVAADRPGAPVEALQALPGGLIQSLGVGAAMTRFDPTPDTLTALARELRDEQTHLFDASLTAGPGGLVGNGGTYLWNFGDGTTATGRIVTHDFAGTGDYDVTLRVTHGGASDEFRFVVESTDPTLLALRFGTRGADDTSSYDAPVTLRGAAVSLASGNLVLTDNNYVTLDRAATEHLHALDNFTLSIDLQRASTASGTTGTIMEINNAWRASMDQNGRIVFRITNSDGDTVTLTSSEGIRDTAWHNVSIHYDGEAGRARAFIDDALVGSIAVDGASPALNAWAPVIGSPWNASFNGRISAIDILDGLAVGGVPGGTGTGGTGTDGTDTGTDGTDTGGTGGVDPRIALATTALRTSAFAELANRLEISPHWDGVGDAEDNFVRANAATADGMAGDDVVFGNGWDNTVIGGAGNDVLAGASGGDEFRFAGGALVGPETDTLLDLAFSRGDEIVLTGYASGSFAGAETSVGLTLSGSTGATLRSLAGIEALYAADAVSVETDGADLMLEIAQSRGTHELRLVGLAEAYQDFIA